MTTPASLDKLITRTVQINPSLIGSAVYSPCERYRYSLARTLEDSAARSVLWIMLNPSTATEEKPDPTVRRCWNYTLAWGCQRMTVCNLFAFRATDPNELKRVDDPVGPQNDALIRWEAAKARMILLAWGNRGCYGGRASRVMHLLSEHGYGPYLHWLRLTGVGEPAHPLYLRRDLRPVPAVAPPGR